MSSHANISDTPFDQRSPQPLEEGVLNCHRHTERQTDNGLGHSMTESAQWGQFSEKSHIRETLNLSTNAESSLLIFLYQNTSIPEYQYTCILAYQHTSFPV